VSRNRARVLTVILIAGACVSLGGLARAQELRIERSHQYVQGYTVMDGIAVPVIGVATDRVYFNVSSVSVEIARPPLRLKQDQRKALDKFFADTLPPKPEKQAGGSAPAHAPSR